jgi:hypothetical protein
MTIINIYMLKVVTCNFIKQIVLDIKSQIDFKIIVGDFNTLLSTLEKSSRQKNNQKEISELNEMIGQMDFIGIYRIFNPTTAKHTFF